MLFQSFEASKIKWKTYQNDYFSIDYPKKWIVLEARTTVFFPGPMKVGKIEENFSVFRDSLTPCSTLETYSKYLHDRAVEIKELNVLESKIIKTDHEKYYLLTYYGKYGSIENAKFMERVIVVNDIGYRQVFVAKRKNFTAYLFKVNHMMESFKIIE
jgi:ribosomal protein S10